MLSPHWSWLNMRSSSSGAVHDPTAASHTFRCRHPFAAATKEKQKNISVGLTCSKRREILFPPSTRGKHIRYGRRATKCLCKNYRVAAKILWGKLLFFFLAALMFYKTISWYKLFKVTAQGAVLCVMCFCDTLPSQKAIQLFPPPPPLATIVSVWSKRKAFLWSRSVDGFIHSWTQYTQCENMLPQKSSCPFNRLVCIRALLDRRAVKETRYTAAGSMTRTSILPTANKKSFSVGFKIPKPIKLYFNCD